jgi:hypothetical protein
MANKFNPPAKCRLCVGAMKEGIFLPNSDTLGYKGQSGRSVANIAAAETWWEVVYRESTSFGMTIKGIALTGLGTPYLVIHYRCEDCGYLESYAPEPIAVSR